MPAANRLLAVTMLGALLVLTSCATTEEQQAERLTRHELAYVSEFCEAHAMVGLTEAIDRQLSLRWRKIDAALAGVSSTRSVTLHQRMLEYSSRWQHLHQSMTTACRDFAICRYRAASAASEECDRLRDRLERITADGHSFLLTLGRIELDRQADGSSCPDCPL